MNTRMLFGGETRRWKDGEILWAENDIMTAAYVATDDEHMIGTVGWHHHGVTEIWVEYVSRDHAHSW